MSSPAVSGREASLATLAVRSGAAVSLGRIAQGVVGVAAVAVLARLLTPSDFGVLAMVVPFSLIVTNLLNRGLHTAILHEDRLTPEQTRTLFWLGQRFNVGLLAVMALGAPLLARIYHEPRVTLVGLLLTAALVFHALAAFPDAILKREMRFGVATAVQLIGIVSGALAAVAAAMAGFTAAALGLQRLVWYAVRCAGTFAVTRWSPGPPRVAGADRVRVGSSDSRIDSTNPSRIGSSDPEVSLDALVRYSTHLTSARAVTWFARQGDRIVVGYFSGAASLGLYDGARRWSWYPILELFASANDVVVASLSKARHDARAFREYCRRGFATFLALPLPAVAFVGLEADRVVRTLLGERWVDAVPMVRILSVAAFIDSVTRLTVWLYVAEGRTREQLVWSVVSSIVMMTAVLAVGRGGVEAMTWAFATVIIAMALPSVAYCLRTSMLTTRDFVASVWRPVVAAAVAALLWMRLSPMLPLPAAPAFALAFALPLFFATYAVVWVSLPGGRVAVREMADVVRALR